MENLELPAMGIYALLFDKLLEPPLKHSGYIYGPESVNVSVTNRMFGGVIMFSPYYKSVQCISIVFQW